MVACSSERRIGVSNTLSGFRGPAIDASNATVSLYGSDRAWIQFVVNEMPTIAMQIDPFRELIRYYKHVGTEWTVKDGDGRVRLPIMDEETSFFFAFTRFADRQNA